MANSSLQDLTGARLLTEAQWEDETKKPSAGPSHFGVVFASFSDRPSLFMKS